LDIHTEKLGEDKSKEILEDTTPLKLKEVLSKAAIDEKKSKGMFLTEAEHTTDEMLKAGWSEKDIAENKDEITPLIEDANLEGYTPSKKLREQATDRLIEHVKKTGNPGTYVALDIHNLGGLTSFFEENHPDGKKAGRRVADEHLKVITGILRKAIVDITPEGDTDDFFRYGGDELGIVSTVNIKAVEDAINRASVAIAKYERDNNLVGIRHSKDSVLGGGLGLSYSAVPVNGSFSKEDISQVAENNINEIKKGNKAPYSDTSKRQK
jgi:GGDEF domain-containing protein